MTIFQDEEDVLVWKDIKSESKLKEWLHEYVSAHNLSLKDVESLKITGTDLEILNGDAFTELRQLSKLEIHSCNWFTLPAALQLPSTLTELHLKENNITELSADVFKNLPLLEILALEKNEIDALANGVFSSLRNLKRLVLLDNDIENNNPAALIGFTATDTLEEIIINDGIRNVEAEAFQGLKKIKTIDLNHNYHLSWPPTLFSNLTSIEFIGLQGCCSNHLEEAPFKTLCNLVKLNLSCNQIHKIPRHAFRDLKALTELYLGSNRITNIDENTLQETPNLKVLNLHANHLKRVPRLSTLTNLRCLFLQKNHITVLENNDFNGLGGLLTLDLSKNYISQIEKDTFKNLSSLFTLSLQRNPMETIRSGCFTGLGQLHSLNLSSSGIRHLERGCFGGLNNLHTLNIGLNNIYEIKSQLFDQLASLTTLFLNNNGIKSIDINAFAQLKKLRSLDLSGNGEVDFNLLFDGLNELQFLDLHNNRLKSIRKVSTEAVHHLTFLNISGCNIEELSLDCFDRLPSLAIVKVSRIAAPEVLIDWQRKYNRLTFLQDKRALNCSN